MSKEETLKAKIKNLREHNKHLLRIIGAIYADKITGEWMEKEREEKLEDA